MTENKVGSHSIGHLIYFILFILLVVLSVLFYNYFHIIQLVYLGFITLVFSVSALTISIREWKKSLENNDEIRGKVVSSGLYGYIRHPEYMGHILIILALVLISQFPLNVLLGVTLISLLWYAMIEEEKENIKKFGEKYKEYMEKVPRINVFYGIIKHRKTKK
ncbi:MAG: methyltransferase family protein [Candidatus Njordarchaeia archaeon]